MGGSAAALAVLAAFGGADFLVAVAALAADALIAAALIAAAVALSAAALGAETFDVLADDDLLAA
jgi:hypothetical protein